MLANMTQEQTDRENWQHCKSVAEAIEKVTDGSMYRCPECGEVIEWSDADALADTREYHCPRCGCVFPEDELEPYGIYDHFNDVYDIEYRIGSDREYRSVRLMVACGGPNIYIDTASKAVELYWWTDRASFPLSTTAANAIDDEFEQLYACY